ncbi:MAG TPA: AbrB/MazE/SpoVT family DNA-binding domain-containing protein [Caulobacteraceae bacterium]|jgi:antitoxin VapB|nr:AbrB/MazE/SpoVT family DNA-binding domain-containing protein [Caulobacteraceae bacterium]
MAEAKLFKVGGSQAVRLPKEFRMPGDKVRIHKEGDRVILEPIAVKRWQSVEEVRAWLAEIHTLAGHEPIERDQTPMQERDWSKFD